MPKRMINEGVIVHRDGKRVRPEIGKLFDLTADEIADIEKVRPRAISTLKEVEEDERGSAQKAADDDNDNDDDNADAKSTAAAAKTTAAKTTGRGKGKSNADGL